MKRFLLCMSLLYVISTLLCVEVGGHISRNTTWTPVNNPYIITSFLYVDAGVTLTIQPGVQVQCIGADKSNIFSFMWSGNSQPEAKMIVAYGKIYAVGSIDNPITFDKHQEGANYRWGGIYMANNARTSTFEYCEFRNTFFCDYTPGQESLAAVVFENGSINMRNCLFDNNRNAIGTSSLQSDVLLYKCKFISINDSYPPPFGLTGFLGIGANTEPVPEENYLVTIASCYFTGNAVFGTFGDHTDVLYLTNTVNDFTNNNKHEKGFRYMSGSVSSYGNTSFNGSKGWGCSSATAADTVFARRNILIKPENANPAYSPLILGSSGFGTNYVSDNYLSGYVQVKTTMSNATTSYIYNNVIENSYEYATLMFENINTTYQGGQIRFFNNLVTCLGNHWQPIIYTSNETSPFIYNNSFIGFRSLFVTIIDSDMVFENNVIPCIQWSTGSVEEEHHPLLINNCLAREILSPWDMIDGGSNIVASPLLADSLNGDYSLSADSPCIDTGAFRPDLPQFDIMYNKRIVSGTGSGQQTIDIGAYEYNSSYIGGLRGVVYNPDSGEMIDCVKIEISQKLPEFSDIVGSFVYPTGPGVYTVRASRWDYEDQVIENVVVNEGEVVELAIPMHLTSTDIDDPVTPPMTQIKATNYPNPFNPETTISFFLPEAGITELCIYNLKGQMLCRLLNAPLSVGTHRLVWDGKDDRNTPVASGMYLYRLQSGKHKFSGKMVLAK